MKISRAHQGILGLTLGLAASLVILARVMPWEGLNPFFVSRDERTRRLMVREQMDRLTGALDAFHRDHGFFPSTAQGLEALVIRPRIPPVPKRYPVSGYLGQTFIPRDPWGRAFIYRSPDGDRSFRLYSRGRLVWYPGDDFNSGDTRLDPNQN